MTSSIWSPDPLAVPIYPSLAASSGSSLVGFVQTATGAVATTVQTKVRAVPYDAVVDFGCDNTGATNTTTKLKAFYDACIATGHQGFIPAGTYKVTPGILKFYNGAVATVWPEITTAGRTAVIYSVDTATNVDAPILEWTSVVTNGDHGATWVVNGYWYGGCHGGITITDNSGQTAPKFLTLTDSLNWLCTVVATAPTPNGIKPTRELPDDSARAG